MDSSTETWPSELPLPKTFPSYGLDTQNLRTEMETSRVRVRPQFSVPREVLSVSWSFTEDQFSVFETFHRVTLLAGTLSFLIELFGEEKEVSFLDATYEMVHTDNLFAVSAALEYTPQ